MIQPVLQAIAALVRGRGAPILVALDGRSGSGKSSLATALARVLSATVVPSDDFFAAHVPAASWALRTASERAKDCIDWRRLRREALEPLLGGSAAAWHPFDFAAGERSDGTFAMSTDIVSRVPAPVVLLDGVYSSRPELEDLVDLSILVIAHATIRRERLSVREDPQSLKAWRDTWDAAEEHYFSVVRPPNAFDLVVDTSVGTHRLGLDL